MHRQLLSAAVLALVASLGHAAEGAAAKNSTAKAGLTLPSGVATQYFDPAVRPQDDFFAYQNGKWLATAQIPSDMPMLDPFVELNERALAQLRAIIEQAEASPGFDADARRIGDFYASFMDEARIERLGAAPLKPEMARIAALKDKSELPGILAHMAGIGVPMPFGYGIGQDSRDATRYAVTLGQGGLGLPNADYYLKLDDPKMADIKAKYLAFAEKMLALAGAPDAAAHARAVVDFETALAREHWSPVEMRDPVKTYNKVNVAELGKLAPGFDWNRWLQATSLAGRTDYVIVSQPSYLTAFTRIADATPLETWKAYITLHLVKDYSRFLSKDFVDTNFDFMAKNVFGIAENAPRWKRGIGIVEMTQGEALGKLYVAKYFPAESRARVQGMVDNLLATYKESIDTLDWMSPATRKEAQTKLARIHTKIGYPDKWRDYSTLVVRRDDLVGNMMRYVGFADKRQLDKLGKPIDRSEWNMTPQTVNAYYEASMNEIVFPAVMLQPPFFNPDADDAVNYGGIGTVIAHEISHAFDDEGSQYDGDGNLRNWWTKEDHARFKAKAQMLVKQYAMFEPVKGYHVNGELTLGENIADNSGLAIAYKAYHRSLHGKPAPVIDGLTGDQRLYLGYGQNWRQKASEAFQIMLVKTDPHSPGLARTNGALINQPGFYEAFKLKPGDRMYLAPKDRVSIW